MEYATGRFIYTLCIKIGDALAVAAAWTLGWSLRFAYLPIYKGLPPREKYTEAILPLMLIFSAVFHMIGAYRKEKLPFGFRSIKKMAEASLVSTLVFIAWLYFQYELDYSRIYLALFSILAILVLSLERTLLHLIWNILETRFIRKQNFLLVGEGPLITLYQERLLEDSPYPLQMAGHLPNTDRLLLTIRKSPIDQVILSFSSEQQSELPKALSLLANEMVTVKVLPDYGKFSTFTYQAEEECGIPLLMFNRPPLGPTDHFLKRCLDISAGLLALLIFSPIMFIIALLVKWSSKGPVFYIQDRLGMDGREFKIYKFRSMRMDAESKTGAVWAKPDDDRTTAIGKILRQTSLDELPQLINVIRGEMSLVGPRPERRIFVDKFRDQIPKYMLRHKMKSGITGWAQVNGWRGNTSLDERIKYDLYYIGHWSVWFDIKILLMTLWKGFVHRNAY